MFADSVMSGLNGLTAGFAGLHWSNPVMMIIGGLLLWLGIKKDCEPLLLVPIGFGCILINIPLAGLMEKDGFLRILYDAGVITELFPLFIFVRGPGFGWTPLTSSIILIVIITIIFTDVIKEFFSLLLFLLFLLTLFVHFTIIFDLSLDETFPMFK